MSWQVGTSALNGFVHGLYPTWGMGIVLQFNVTVVAVIVIIMPVLLPLEQQEQQQEQ